MRTNLQPLSRPGRPRLRSAVKSGRHAALGAAGHQPAQLRQARRERAEIPLVSSHWPWAKVPRLLDWDAVGDGSVFDRPGAGPNDPVQVVESDPDRMRDGYRRSIEYSLSTLVSYVETHGDDDLVLVFLGDHQPPAFVAGDGAGRDVLIDRHPRPRRPRPDRRVGMAGRAATRPACAGLAHGVIP
jgi:hypothetical protein